MAWSDFIFLDVIESAAMDAPLFSEEFFWNSGRAFESVVEGDEVEGGTDPGDGGDDVEPS